MLRQSWRFVRPSPCAHRISRQLRNANTSSSSNASSSSSSNATTSNASTTTSASASANRWIGMKTMVFGGMCAGVVGWLGRSGSSSDEKDAAVLTDPSVGAIGRMRHRVLSIYKAMIDPDTDALLPDAFPPGHPYHKPYTLLLELDKALVHSHWDKDTGWSVAKRPWVDYFLAYMSQFYEIVVFTSQTPYYAAPILDKLDASLGAIFYRLYRDSTHYDIMTGNHVKELAVLNRPLNRVILMDPNPNHYQSTQPENVIEMPEWDGDPNDTWLLDMIPFMETLAVSGVDDVRPVLGSYKGKDIPKQFAHNMAQVQKQQREKMLSTTPDTVESSKQGWAASVQDGVLSFFGLKRPPTAAPVPQSEKEFVKLQAQQYQQFMRDLDHHRKIQEEEIKKMEEEQKRIMERAKNVKITLLDMLLKGPNDAIMEKADPEVRAYLQKMQAAQSGQQSAPAA